MTIEFNFKNEQFEYTVTVYDWEEEESELEEEEEPNTTCDFCGRSFASVGNLKQHQTVKGHNDQG